MIYVSVTSCGSYNLYQRGIRHVCKFQKFVFFADGGTYDGIPKAPKLVPKALQVIPKALQVIPKAPQVIPTGAPSHPKGSPCHPKFEMFANFRSLCFFPTAEHVMESQRRPNSFQRLSKSSQRHSRSSQRHPKLSQRALQVIPKAAHVIPKAPQTPLPIPRELESRKFGPHFSRGGRTQTPNGNLFKASAFSICSKILNKNSTKNVISLTFSGLPPFKTCIFSR